MKSTTMKKQEVSMDDKIKGIVNSLDRAVKNMEKIIGLGIKKEFKKLPDQYVNTVAEVAIKDRDLTDTEKMIYLMSYFEFGESIQEIAKEHKRSERLVMTTVREAIEGRIKWVDYFIAKGVSRGKIDGGRLDAAVKELHCSMGE